jgi:hypothetical protein
MSVCLLSSSGLRTTSPRILNIQRQHHQQNTAPNHILDLALHNEAVHSHPHLTTHLRADANCRTLAYLRP